MNKLAANAVGLLLTVLFCVAGVGFAHLLPHHVPFAAWHTIVVVVSLILLPPIHEALHALGLRVFARVSWRHVRFGVMWRALMPYCGCAVPIPVRAYRRMALLSLWVTGAATVAALLVFPTNGFGVLAGVAVASCVGDVWIVAKLRRFAGDFLTKDTASEIGCDVYSPAPDIAAAPDAPGEPLPGEARGNPAALGGRESGH